MSCSTRNSIDHVSRYILEFIVCIIYIVQMQVRKSSINPVPQHDLCTRIGGDKSANIPARRVGCIVLQFQVVRYDDVCQHKLQLTYGEETSRASKTIKVEPL